MSYKLTIKQKPSHLHVIVTGMNSWENVASYFAEIMRECMTRRAYRVLIEERLDGPRLGTMDVYQISADGADRARGLFEAIAYVDVNGSGRLMEFAETVAVNRGLPVRVFESVRDARKWLQDMDRRGARSRLGGLAREDYDGRITGPGISYVSERSAILMYKNER